MGAAFAAILAVLSLSLCSAAAPTSSDAVIQSSSSSFVSSSTSSDTTTLSSSATTTALSSSTTTTLSSSSLTTTTVSSSSAANGVQPPPNYTSQHTFSAFPRPTEQPVANVFVVTDPLNPPEVTADYPVIPDFNPAWDAAYTKAQALIAGFTLEDKVNVATGVGWANGRCVGNIPKVKDWPGLCLEDSPLGVRFADFVTYFPTGVNTAATWNRRLIRARGLAMGQEFKGKGVNIALGPMMNLGRVAAGGRNWEGFGADPFLAGEASYETILGMQQGGVQACAKHFLNNEQEFSREMETSDVDDRTQHELYAHPFLRSVMAGVSSVMCSYNQVNSTYACENDKLLNGILKEEFGFQGLVMSDWIATHSTLSVMSGLDMTMPGDVYFGSRTSYFGSTLVKYVNNGTVPESRIDDMATRIIAGWYLLHQDSPDYPATNFNAFNPVDPATNARIDVQDDHWKIAREIGAASTVLLKNKNKLLPFDKPRSLLLAGSDAGPQPGGPNQYADQAGNSGILASGWGSGTANFTYLVSPLEAIQERAREDSTTVNWHLDDFDLNGAGNKAVQADIALVFINSDSGEEYLTVDGNMGDRKNLTAWHGGDNLVLAVAAQNKNTVVVVHSVGPIIMEPWIDHPNVSAVVWAGVSGQETGHSLVDVLYGDWNPSGRLPYTIAKSASDYNVQVITGRPSDVLKIPYTEALNIDYRHFDSANIQPRFEFGFGLSYTMFDYSNLGVEKLATNFDGKLNDAWEGGQPSANGFGSSKSPWLHEPAYRVTFTIGNNGTAFGGEIPQLYVTHPPSADEPPKILKGFTDVELDVGESQTLAITLSRYDLSIWDVVSQSWVRPQGTIKLSVGASSRDLRLFGQIPQ